MIVWIFFEPGTGGDGFANLLEQSLNVVPLDGNKQWRIHRYVDSKVKFWAPNLQNNSFRVNTVEKLTKKQIDIANSNDQFLIITSHDLTLKNVFQKSVLPDNKHIKILLTSNNIKEQRVTSQIKNLIEFNSAIINGVSINNVNLLNFDLHLDTIPDDWNNFKNLVDNIGLNLPKEEFDHYKKIVSGEVLYTTPGIEYYKSVIDVDNITKYIKIN